MSAMGRQRMRVVLGAAAGVLVFGAIAHPSWRLYWIVVRGALQTAEFVGIMDRTGNNLGGQVAGHNYQREPTWVFPAARVPAALVTYGPAAAVSLLVFHRVGLGRLGWRASLCGKCGARMQGLSEPRCSACGGEF